MKELRIDGSGTPPRTISKSSGAGLPTRSIWIFTVVPRSPRTFFETSPLVQSFRVLALDRKKPVAVAKAGLVRRRIWHDRLNINAVTMLQDRDADAVKLRRLLLVELSKLFA